MSARLREIIPLLPRLRCLETIGAGLFGVACVASEPSLGSGAGRGVDDSDAGGTRDAAVDPDPDLPGRPLRVVLEPGQETYVDLAKRTTLTDVERDSTEWDLVFSGWDIFTNSGPSGPGVGAAYGPSDPLELLFDTVPDVPLRADHAEGPLADWFAYQSGTVWSRQHIYGIRGGEQLWKFQILSYYGVVGGVEVSALYRLRYARVTPDGLGEVIELDNVDGTAGGFGISVDPRAGCLDFDSGEVRLLSAAELAEDARWHLCFRRTQVFLNGGLAGPGGLLGVDLDAAAGEPRDFSTESAAAELERFEAVDHAALSADGLSYQTDDAISSVFSGIWVLDPGPDAQPTRGSWFVRGSDGERYYGLLFTGVESDDEAEAGPRAIELRVKSLRL